MDLLDKARGELLFQCSPQLKKTGVIHSFTTRLGGVSEGIFASLNLGVNRGDRPDRVRENYRRVCEALGVEMGRLVLSRQVHGDHVRQVTSSDWGKGLDRAVDYEADGLVTDTPGTTLVVFGADCPTILLHDPVRKVIGAVHAGWRGTALGIVERCVKKMTERYGCRTEDIVAAIGPGIARCCFETGGEVPEAMRASLGEQAVPFVDTPGNGKYKVDLKGINALRLGRVGVPPANIDISSDCTMCQPEKYWSHRYTGGKRGSQAALISLL